MVDHWERYRGAEQHSQIDIMYEYTAGPRKFCTGSLSSIGAGHISFAKKLHYMLYSYETSHPWSHTRMHWWLCSYIS